MTELEALFGTTPCYLKTHAHVDVASRDPVYVAELYVIEENGHALRPVGGRDGEAIELPGGSEDAAIQRAANYLTERFGRQSGSPGFKKSQWSTRHELTPPLKDERPKS